MEPQKVSILFLLKPVPIQVRYAVALLKLRVTNKKDANFKKFESAWNIRGHFKGSRFVCVNDGTDGSLRQDRYSIRTVSWWIGPCLENLRLGYEQISVECNSVTGNIF